MQYAALIFCGLGGLLLALGILGRLAGAKDYGISRTMMVAGLFSIMLGAVFGLIFLCLV